MIAPQPSAMRADCPTRAVVARSGRAAERAARRGDPAAAGVVTFSERHRPARLLDAVGRTLVVADRVHAADRVRARTGSVSSKARSSPLAASTSAFPAAVRRRAIVAGTTRPGGTRSGRRRPWGRIRGRRRAEALDDVGSDVPGDHGARVGAGDRAPRPPAASRPSSRGRAGPGCRGERRRSRWNRGPARRRRARGAYDLDQGPALEHADARRAQLADSTRRTARGGPGRRRTCPQAACPSAASDGGARAVPGEPVADAGDHRLGQDERGQPSGARVVEGEVGPDPQRREVCDNRRRPLAGHVPRGDEPMRDLQIR